MPAERATVDRPLFPLHQMTTHELSGYRCNLEREIQRLPADVGADLRRRLDDVLAEEDDRRRIAARVGR
jgi:hypothetical protein